MYGPYGIIHILAPLPDPPEHLWSDHDIVEVYVQYHKEDYSNHAFNKHAHKHLWHNIMLAHTIKDLP